VNTVRLFSKLACFQVSHLMPAKVKDKEVVPDAEQGSKDPVHASRPHPNPPRPVTVPIGLEAGQA
jgi:hypothetical protein